MSRTHAKIIATAVVVAVLSEKSGWASIKTVDGEESKIRSGKLEDVTPAEAAKFDKAATKAAEKAEKAKARAEKAATKAANTAEKAARAGRAPRPAHFVAEVSEGEAKIAKIGKTEFDLGRYLVSDVKTPSGRRTIDCADDVAESLRGMDLDGVYASAAATLKIDEAELRKLYEHLNPGMQRMNLGNRIRGALAKAEKEAAKEAAAAE